MTTDITSPVADAAETAGFLSEDWFDPLEAGVRTRIRAFIEELLEAELEAALGRKRYARGRTPDNEPSAKAARSPGLRPPSAAEAAVRLSFRAMTQTTCPWISSRERSGSCFESKSRLGRGKGLSTTTAHSRCHRSHPFRSGGVRHTARRRSLLSERIFRARDNG